MTVMEMPWWMLPLSICLAWLLWIFACVAQVGLEDARNPLPDGRRRSFSPAPVVPLFPLAFWGLAKLIDLFAAPWGSTVIVVLHATYAAVLGVALLRDVARLRALPIESDRDN
jgi:hypothetical protein